MTKRQHEIAVCNAVRSVLEQRRGGPISEIGAPDTTERNRAAVELLLQSPSCRYVLEHTLVESYAEQIRDGREFVDLLQPLETDLSGRLPSPGPYILGVGARAVRGATRADDVRRALVAWIEVTAPTLAIGSPKTAPRHFCRAKIPGVPFEVTLCRWGYGEGALKIARDPSTLLLPRERRLRILTALFQKCGKLYTARAEVTDAGFPCESVLVLETNDIALANLSVISRATVACLRWLLRYCPQYVPDHVLVADTSAKSGEVWVVKEQGNTFRSFYARYAGLLGE